MFTTPTKFVRKKRKPRSKKSVQPNVPPAGAPVKSARALPAGTKRGYIRKPKNKAVPLLYVIECDQCGEHFENENSYFEHKKGHSFARIALRMHIEQKRNHDRIPVPPQDLMSPDKKEQFVEGKIERLKGKRKPNPVIQYSQQSFDCDALIDDEAIKKLPTVKVYNVRTKTRLTKDLLPMPEISVMKLVDENDNKKSTDEK